MNARQLITILRSDFLKDDISDYSFSDTTLLRYLTEAERQACNRANLIYDEDEITLVAGTHSYALSQKITVVERVIFDGKPIPKMTKDELDAMDENWRTDSGMLNNNVGYLLNNRTIRFTPYPNASDDGLKVYVEHYRLPASDITTVSSTPEIPTENHRDLIYWVLYECYNRADMGEFAAQKAIQYYQQFESVFGRYVDAKVRQHQFESPRMLNFTLKTPTDKRYKDFDHED